MKINCGPSPEAEYKALTKWHDFYPWFPRRVGENDCRCFEVIERKGQYYSDSAGGAWAWEYRAKQVS